MIDPRGLVRCLLLFAQSLIDDGVTIHAFTLDDGQDCRCIDVYSQGSLAAAGISPSELTFEPVTPPSDLPPKRTDSADGIIRHDWNPIDGSPDDNGNIRECPKYSFPRIIPRLEQLSQFRNLDDYMRQGR